MNINVILIVACSFLIGSIPFGFIFTKKLAGVDVRTVGSGNIGSTNVKRAAGSKISLYTQIMDILKGLIPVVLAMFLYPVLNTDLDKDLIMSLCAVFAILGHDYTPFLKFKGGKGVNTTLGSFLLICPIPVLLSVFTHKILGLVTDIVSIRSLLLGFVIPLTAYFMNYGKGVVLCALVAAILIVIRHESNIRRLINGDEK
ncbi:MAG: glycerol-3-phosphate 1-O-acyltransferase PlsY [Peptostreptococcaceae bacterium]|jgi:glycerol-3-phosphate acyltransferase PlsY|nr:glycerol-3-phosphate 1-O-acyltransferase PlsY [Peptostreptococcaceae bacterium]